MKRWAQRILGHTLEETRGFTAGYSSGRQSHTLGISATYGDNPMKPPVYHFSEQQQGSFYGGFMPHGTYHSRGNMYNPQRTPLPQGPQLRGSQFQGPYSQGMLIPRAVPFLLQHKPHHAISLPNPYSAFLNPENKPPSSQKTPTTQEKHLPHRLSLAPARPSTPVPNPSGRITPPHKRSPKKKKKKPTAAEKSEIANTDSAAGSVVKSWTKAGQNLVPKLIVEKWAKGKQRSVSEGQETTAANQPEQKLPHSASPFPSPSEIHHLGRALGWDNKEGNSPATQPQDRIESATDRVDKRKGKQKKVAEIQKDQITSNGEGSPTAPQHKVHITSIIAAAGKSKGPPATVSQITGDAVGSPKSATAQPPASQSSGHLVVKTLPNEKKQVVQQVLQPTNVGGSSILYDSPTLDRRKTKVTTLISQATSPEHRHYVSEQEAVKAAIQENDIDKLIANAQMISKNKNIEKQLKPKNQVPVLVKVEGANQLPARPPTQTKGLPEVSKSLAGNLVMVKHEKPPGLDNGEGGSNGFNGQLLAANFVRERKLSVGPNPTPSTNFRSTGGSVPREFVNSKVSISPDNPGLSNAKASSDVSGNNTDPKFPTPTKTPVAAMIACPRPLTSTNTLVTPTSIPYKNTRQPPPSKVLPAMPKQLDFITTANGKTNAHEVIPTNILALIPDTPPPSLPDYAKAASGPNGRNVDQKFNTPPTSPSRNPPTAPVAPTKTITTLITSPSPTITKGPPSSPTSPKPNKSWSSIVTGNSADPNAINKKFQRNRIGIEGFPELGKPLTILSSNQLPRTPHEIWDGDGLNQKASLSAMAEPFEPAEPRHTASADSHLKTNNRSSPPILHSHIPTHPVAPAIMKFPIPDPPLAPILLPQTPIEHMSFPFDHLLGVFYDTPEFTKYLNKSYNELLFKENYLRAQYQRISETFVEEWDYITAQERKSIITKALSNLSERLDRVQLSAGTGMEKLLRDLGLTKYSPSTTPLLHKPTTPNLREAYLQGAPVHEETKKGSSKSVKEAYLKWRAEYCFDCDPDALCISPDWLYSIISRLLGMPHTLRHRFGPVWHKKNFDSSVTPDHEKYTRERLELWCPDDCLDCKEAENTGWPTEWTFVRNSQSRTKDSLHSSSSEIEVPRRNLPNDSPFQPSSPHTQNSPGDIQDPFVFSQLSFLKKARLMSNRFTDPIFARSDGWKAANPGRTKFMELMNIDIALFYCELIEEILQIFGEVRRERIWITLPSIADYHEGLPIIPTQGIRGRPRTRSTGKGSSEMRTSITSDSLDQIQRKKGREYMHTRVLEERKRMWEFVNEVQRTTDWKIAGLRLVDRDTDREVERAYDGGLWTIPVPPQEKEMLEREFAKLRV